MEVSLVKDFGLPNNRILGENARIGFRLDAYNVFNNLNFNPLGIVNNIDAANFGTITAAKGQNSGGLAGRVVTLGARFVF